MTSDGDDDFGSGDDGSSSSSSPSVVAKLDDRPFLRGGRRSLGKPQGWQQPDDDSDSGDSNSGGDSDRDDDDDDDSLDSAAADHEGDLESSNDSVTDDVKESDISEEDDDEHSEEDSTNERNQSSLTLGELLSSKEQKLSKDNSVFLHAKERKAKARLLISERLANFKKSERQKDNNHHDNETSDHDKDDDRPSSKSNYNSKLKQRKSKHAPTEVSSKRKDFYQRRRRRQTLNESGIGVEIGAHRYKPRDPRLSSLSSAPGNEDQTEQNYAFLHDIRTQETELLQKRIKARQMTGKRGTRQRHKLGLTNASTTTTTTTLEDDVQKLKYLQQQKAQMERQQLERQAKRTVKKRLQQQVETGQRSANHFLNRRTMKAMYTEAKFEEIRKQGGEQAVEKALAKRRKKNKSRDAKTGLPRQRQQVHTTT